MCVCGCACDCTCNGWVSREDRALRTLQCGCVVGCGCVGYTKDGVGGGVESCSSFFFLLSPKNKTKERKFTDASRPSSLLPFSCRRPFLSSSWQPGSSHRLASWMRFLCPRLQWRQQALMLLAERALQSSSLRVLQTLRTCVITKSHRNVQPHVRIKWE